MDMEEEAITTRIDQIRIVLPVRDQGAIIQGSTDMEIRTITVIPVPASHIINVRWKIAGRQEYTAMMELITAVIQMEKKYIVSVR